MEVDGKSYESVAPQLPGFSKHGDAVNAGAGSRLLDFDSGEGFHKEIIRVEGRWLEIPKGKEKAYAARRNGGTFGTVAKEDYGDELILKPGNHKIRVALICPSARALQGHGVIRSVSQTVEVEVVARELEDESPEERIIETCREHLRSLPASQRLSALANSLPHDRMRGVQVLGKDGEALALLAMEEGLDRIPHDDLLWSFDLRKDKGHWRATTVGQVPNAEEYVSVLKEFRNQHPVAKGWGAALPSQVSEKLMTTYHRGRLEGGRELGSSGGAPPAGRAQPFRYP